MRKILDRACLLSTLFLLLPLKAFANTSLTEIIPRIKRELVTIQSSERPERQGQSYDPYFYFFKQPLPAGRKNFPLGSGFVLPGGKHIATSARSLENLNRVEIVNESGNVLQAKLLGIDANLDLALLEIEPGKRSKGFAGVDFGDSRQSRLGESFSIFGRAIRFLLLKGHLVSNDVSEGPYGRHWLIDVATNPGLAGGPVVDNRGRVIGMAVHNPKGPEHYGTVLPAHMIQESAKQLARYGKPQRAWLGLVPRPQANLDDLDHIHDGSAKSGLIAENLIVDGPAAKAGLQIGDILLAIDGKSLASLADLFRELEKRKAGDRVTLKVHRSSKGVIEVKLNLGELPNARELPNAENLL